MKAICYKNSFAARPSLNIKRLRRRSANPRFYTESNRRRLQRSDGKRRLRKTYEIHALTPE